ncbi:MAG: ATP synthase F1 subunit gamma [Erysipelotrichaceae bacterium]
MALNQQAIKSRINSVLTTTKITNAMELISSTKLRKMRSKMDAGMDYSLGIEEMVQKVVASSEQNIESQYLKPKKSLKVLHIVFTSDMGLCGAYNANSFKLLENLPKDDLYLVVGSKGGSWLKHKGYNIVDVHYGFDKATYKDIDLISSQAIDKFVADEVGVIDLVYTKFINAVTFKAEQKQLLPLQLDIDDSKSSAITLFEPSSASILEQLLPLYIKSTIYQLFLESKTSEQAYRRLAMESATDNGEKIVDELLLKYNQARQSAITQEISEIVSGADAL